jgi:hypothetical protein
LKRELRDLKHRFLLCTIAALALIAVFGCGRGQNSASPVQWSQSAVLPQAAVVDPATAGAIRGTVSLEGAPPALYPINMSSEAACAKANPSPVVSPEVVTGENGALANVVVYVKSGLGERRFDTPQHPVILDQKGCMYEPHIVALMTNQTLEIRNDDATIHNVHAMPKDNNEWNKAQRAGGAALETSFPRPELAIQFMCNVHPWMRAFVFVFSNPYYAVTSKTGSFELKNLPPGVYTIEAWQEKYGAQDQAVTIGPRESTVISFRFKS